MSPAPIDLELSPISILYIYYLYGPLRNKLARIIKVEDKEKKIRIMNPSSSRQSNSQNGLALWKTDQRKILNAFNPTSSLHELGNF